MHARIYSSVVDRAIAIALATTASVTFCCDVQAQSGSRYQTDPQTGIVYEPRTTTIDRPVVETKIEKREQTVYRPQTVTETRPENRTTYSPVVEYKWEPRLHGRWNPFTRPTIQYHHVGETKWEARNEVVQRTNTRTDWVAEKRTVEVPTQVVRMQREQKTDLVAVGRVAPKQPVAAPVNSAIATRLRPLNNNETIAPISQPRVATTFRAPRIAASTVGRMTSDPPRRSIGQGGLRANTLGVAPGVRGQALPPVSGGVGIANLPSLPILR